MRGRGWALVSATVDHGARLHFCTRDSISVSTHPSCEVVTWFGSSMGVASIKLGTFEGTRGHRVNELAEAYASYVAQELVPLGMGLLGPSPSSIV